MTSMTSTKPYLLRAFCDWITDNNLTPHIAVNADIPGTIVPTQFIESGKIILNISSTSVKNLMIENTKLYFDARFSGVLMHIVVPINAVLAIYARENGRGMVFGEEEQGDNTPPPTIAASSSAGGKGSKPKLTIVK